MLRRLRGVPQYFGLQASYRPKVLNQFQASFKTCLCKIPRSHSFLCLFVGFEVLIPRTRRFLSSKSWIRDKLPPLIYFFLAKTFFSLA